jgi:hypothetical protein
MFIIKQFWDYLRAEHINTDILQIATGETLIDQFYLGQLFAIVPISRINALLDKTRFEGPKKHMENI